jgi:type IV pilus assembly PilN-like protein
MSNLLPAASQKDIRAEMRARFLFAFSLVVFCGAVLCALALIPAEVSLLFYAPPPTQVAQHNIDIAADNAAVAHTNALLTAMQPFATSSSLDDISEALSKLGTGVSVNDISYNVIEHSLSLAGKAQTPDEVNALRQALQADPTFTNVSVPVSALLGSQGGGFTITMNVTQ